MSFGVSTASAHLDVRTAGGPTPKEIDWAAFRTWNNNQVPQFAGRYFLGARYLWAHGEGSSAATAGTAVARIAPIQRADKRRQEETGDRGVRYGEVDGSAIADYIARCVAMGELEPASDFVNVYLEVADGTTLSPDYWTAWALTLFNRMVLAGGASVGGITLPKPLFPLLPCVLCTFPKDTATAKYAPGPGVTQALDNAGASVTGRRARCYALWARAADNAVYHAPQPQLDWSAFKPYEQTLGSKKEVVPVRLWRHMEEPDQQNPQPAAARRLSLDASRVDAGKDVGFDSMLVVKAWTTSGRPSQFGVDKGAILSKEIRCLAQTPMTLHNLPDTPTPGKPVNPALSGETTFAIRYYSSRPNQPKNAKDMSLAEVKELSRAGADVVACYQAEKLYDDIPEYLSTPGSGNKDGEYAFVYATDRIGQPAHTPIYFSIDTDVKTATVPTPVAHRGQSPNPDQIKTYFTGVAQAYDAYLAGREDPTPYYIGVYGCRTVMDMLYIEGLATHFWQAVPPSWGDPPPQRPNVDAWPHANAWQVCNGNHPAFANSGVVPCRKSSKWDILITGATGGNFKLKVGPTWSGQIPWNATGAEVATLVRTLTTGTVSGDDAFDVNNNRVRVLTFSEKVVVDINVDDITAPAGVQIGFGAVERFDFLDLDVAWGDPGGWKIA